MFIAEIMIAVTGAAANFGCFCIQQGHNRVIGDAAALHAIVVNDVAEAQITHQLREYITMAHRDWHRFNPTEQKMLRGLTTPARIQRFLDCEIGYNLEPKGATCYSPRLTLRHKIAHCMEGALLGAVGLRLLGFEPLIVDLEAVRDTDHVLAVYRARGHWGAVAKSDYSGLRSREPVYRTIRELAISYFEDYFNPKGEKTLRTYSRPVNLRRFDRIDWMTQDRDVWEIPNHLCDIPHSKILEPGMEKTLARMDDRLYKAGRLGGAAH